MDKKLALSLSIILFTALLTVTILMNINSSSRIFEGLLTVTPLIVAYIFILLSNRNLLNLSNRPSEHDEFSRDLLIISYSYLLATLFSLIFNYKNSDVKGWWPVITYLSWIYGLAFAFIYSSISKLLNNHRKYTNIFALLIFTIFTFISFYPRYISFLYFEEIEIIWVLFATLLLIHCLIVSIYCLITYSRRA